MTAVAVWFGLSLPGALLVARCIEPPKRPVRPRRHKQVEPAPEVVNRIPVLPPVPIARDLEWLLDQPAEIRLTDTEVGIRLRDIEAAEGWVR